MDMKIRPPVKRKSDKKRKKSGILLWPALLALICSGLLNSRPLPIQAQKESGDQVQTDNTVQPADPDYVKVNLFNYSFSSINQNIPFDGDNGNAVYNSNGINANHNLIFGSGSRNQKSVSTAYTADHGDFDDINGWQAGKIPKRFVERNLINGYPAIRTKAGDQSESLAYLFNPAEVIPSNTAKYTNVKNLFQYDDKGYYFFDSKQNFASFSIEDNAFTLLVIHKRRKQNGTDQSEQDNEED